jgi:hypothetical protein
MPMTRTFCPRCKSPITADINQLFDVNVDPQAKQRILSGNFNIARCPNCGYEGNLATPLVYHDPNKELLLTYFPPELGLPINEQERMVGPLIQQVLSKLPAEKRKAYLLRPQSMLTLQTMIERILEADGITKEMIQAQEQRMNLLQRLMVADAKSREQIAKQEDNLIDESFFSILSRLIEASIQSNDEQSAKQLMDLQQQLLPITTVGKKLQSQMEETQAAARELQQANEKGLTRESLLDLLIAAPSDTRLSTMVGMARGGLDYQFFEILSKRIDQAKGEEKEKLIKLRERLLELTKQVDEEIKAQVDGARKLLDALLKTENVEESTQKILPAVNELFLDVLRNEMEQAQRDKDQNRLAKLNRIVSVIQAASAPPPGVALIEELVGVQNDQERMKILENHREEITPEFLDTFNNLVMQIQTQSGDDEQKALADQIQAGYRAALRFSMQANLKK